MKRFYIVKTVLLTATVVGGAVAFVPIVRHAVSKPEKPIKVNTKLIDANTRFGFKLFAEMAGKDPKENIFLSPSSVAFALAMTYNGAGGTTRDAMAKTLELTGMSLEEVNRANADLRVALEKPASGVTLKTANALWLNQGLQFAPDFEARVQKGYDAKTTVLDMKSASAAPTINGWVAKKTEGKIDDLVQPGDLATAETVLTNAVYFKGIWQTPFDRERTRAGSFTKADGTKKSLPMMYRKGKQVYFRDRRFEAVRLPYGDGATSMYIFLPSLDSGLKEFLSSLTEENWKSWMKWFQTPQEIVLKLPRFKVECMAELKPPLADLGMAISFTPDADFHAMGLGTLFINKVKHKAVMEVAEEGTVAAAATAVIMTRGASPRETIMDVNRPFFCAIRDDRTGSILFMGAIVDPQ